MSDYLIRRLLLLPITLFCILLINFLIINLAPGEPTTVGSISADGMKKADDSTGSSTEQRHLQFREHYGLTLPILWNVWPWMSKETVVSQIKVLWEFKETKGSSLSFKEYELLRLLVGDQSKYLLPFLYEIMLDESYPQSFRKLTSMFFVRGGTQQALLGIHLTPEEKRYNQQLAISNQTLRQNQLQRDDSPETMAKKIEVLGQWLKEHPEFYYQEKSLGENIYIFFFETRFVRYFTRVLTLDFGTLRNDNNKQVIDEVIKRFPISLTLSVLPLIITFVFCQLFGFWMAYHHNAFSDRLFSFFFLVLYAIPVYVAAPFLIENVAMHNHFPWTNIPIPLHGFTSPERVFEQMTTWEKLKDILIHILIPLLAILYSSLATQSRLVRGAVLEIQRLDYVRTAYAKGLSSWTVGWKHIGRNVGIIVITSLAGSLGVILGGSLIVETLFEINGFGKFFYDGILNRDYNVIMFSSIAGAFLTLLGYLMADISYALLDPRVSFE